MAADPPPLEYPVVLTWRVVGHGDLLRAHVRNAVEAVVGPVADAAVGERASSSGRFRSIQVTCEMQSEEQRRDIYERLRASPHVVLVL